jgi:uncharacterized protein (UPF0276 family)
MTYTLGKLKKTIESAPLATTEKVRLQTIANNLQKKRESLKSQLQTEKINSYALQGTRLLEELNDAERIRGFIKSDCPILFLDEITSSTIGVKKRTSKRTKYG